MKGLAFMIRVPVGVFVFAGLLIGARVLAVVAARRADYHAYQSTMADACDYVECIPYHDRWGAFWTRIKRCLIFMLRESER